MPKCTLQIITVDEKGNLASVQEPIVEEGIQWETTRTGEPGKLTFTVMKDETLSFPEGSHVRFLYGEEKVFYGFVFTKQRDKEQFITVTAYDQLRYLKNQTSYIFTGIRADQVLTRIADDFRLKVGAVDNTGYVIPKFNKDNLTLFDMILDAIDDTVIATGNLYFIYDDFGKIAMKNIKDTKLGVLIDNTTAENFDYSSSIDNNTYNRIVLIDSEDKSERNVARAQDDGNINKWGVLQYFEAMSNGSNTKENAQYLLELHNKVHRSLTIRGQKGDVRCRAGFGVYLDLYLGDLPGKQHMLIEKAVHTFKHDEHTMDLTLIGAKTFYE